MVYNNRMQSCAAISRSPGLQKKTILNAVWFVHKPTRCGFD